MTLHWHEKVPALSLASHTSSFCLLSPPPVPSSPSSGLILALEGLPYSLWLFHVFEEIQPPPLPPQTFPLHLEIVPTPPKHRTRCSC